MMINRKKEGAPFEKVGESKDPDGTPHLPKHNKLCDPGSVASPAAPAEQAAPAALVPSADAAAAPPEDPKEVARRQRALEAAKATGRLLPGISDQNGVSPTAAQVEASAAAVPTPFAEPPAVPGDPYGTPLLPIPLAAPAPPAEVAPAAAPDVLDHSIAAVNPEAPVSAPVDQDRVCDNQVYADERAKLIDALSKRKVDVIADTWAKVLQACGDNTPPPKSLTAFNEAKVLGDAPALAQAVINVILSLVANNTITQEKADELLAVKAGRRRRKTPKRKRVRKARNSTFRRHRKH